MRFYEMLYVCSNVTLLDIIIQCNLESDDAEHARALPFIFAIGLAHRWRTLEINTSPFEAREIFPALILKFWTAADSELIPPPSRCKFSPGTHHG